MRTARPSEPSTSAAHSCGYPSGYALTDVSVEACSGGFTAGELPVCGDDGPDGSPSEGAPDGSPSEGIAAESPDAVACKSASPPCGFWFTASPVGVSPVCAMGVLQGLVSSVGQRSSVGGADAPASGWSIPRVVGVAVEEREHRPPD